MKTRTYIIYRVGSNAYNQPMCDRASIGTVEAPDRSVAYATARACFKRECYANQHLDAVAASRVSEADYQEAVETEQRRAWEREQAEREGST